MASNHVLLGRVILCMILSLYVFPSSAQLLCHSIADFTPLSWYRGYRSGKHFASQCENGGSNAAVAQYWNQEIPDRGSLQSRVLDGTIAAWPPSNLCEDGVQIPTSSVLVSGTGRATRAMLEVLVAGKTYGKQAVGYDKSSGLHT